MENQKQSFVGDQNWKNISPDFTEELKQGWTNKGFSTEEVKDWIDIGLGVNDFDFAGWLKDGEGWTPEEVLNSSENLREEYQKPEEN